MVEKPEKTELTYEYTKRRREFGKQLLFEDHGPEMRFSIPNQTAHYKNYILRNPVNVAIQNTPNMSEHWVNSYRAEYTCSGVNHVEGGWPKDINMNDPEAAQRYRRKIEKDESYIHAVMHLGHSMEHNILQNNAIDMYETYYSELPAIPPVERSSCHTVNVYREPGAKRAVRALSWQADGGARLAAAHADVDLMRTNRIPQMSYIWDIENANAPELIIKPPQPLLDLQYNPRDQHTLAGGMMNGQVGWWDTRKGGEPVILCPPHEAHRDLVRNVLFINSKTGAEFFSSSPDGVVKWWDTRNMSEPSDSMIIDMVKLPTDTASIENAIGISALEYEPTIPTRFMVGTETGLVIGGNRKGKNPVEKLPSKYEAHLGPVYSLQRNPTFLKNFLTVGDWTARVWSEDCRESSIMWTSSHSTKLTDGAWNPVRFSVMLVTQWDGCLSCWDLLRRRSAPIVTAQICDEPLLRLRPHEGGLLVACGSSKGTVYLAELSSNLGTADKNDKQLLTHVCRKCLFFVLYYFKRFFLILALCLMLASHLHKTVAMRPRTYTCTNTARVWSEDCRESSIMWTSSHSTKLTDGAWNPVRFSVMLVTQWDGCLSCWDLLRRRSAPIVTAQICDEPLLRLRPHEGGLLVACGSSKGTVYLAELSSNLGTADKNDKQLLTHIFERENKRERILEARMRELRLKMRQGGDGGPQVTENDSTSNDRDLEEATAEYMQCIEELQAQQKAAN